MALTRTSADDRFDLSDHMPFGPDEGFEEAGYQFKGWQPANDKARHVAVIQAFRKQASGDELADEVLIQMSYPNIFGVDIADVAAIEAATDELIGELEGRD